MFVFLEGGGGERERERGGGTKAGKVGSAMLKLPQDLLLAEICLALGDSM